MIAGHQTHLTQIVGWSEGERGELQIVYYNINDMHVLYIKLILLYILRIQRPAGPDPSMKAGPYTRLAQIDGRSEGEGGEFRIFCNNINDMFYI